MKLNNKIDYLIAVLPDRMRDILVKEGELPNEVNR